MTVNKYLFINYVAVVLDQYAREIPNVYLNDEIENALPLIVLYFKEL